MSYRVIQWGPGRMGSIILRTMLLRPDEFDVVGTLVYSDAKDGRDIGELAGLGPVGVLATKDKQAIFDLDADCVVFTPINQPGPSTNHADMLALLASGKNVLVNHDYFFPAAISAQYAADVEDAGRRGNATVMAVGSSPGFVAERLATTLAGHCVEIEHIDIIERMDCTTHPAHIYPILGFGLPPDQFGDSPIVPMFDAMYRQTPYAMAKTLGQTLQRVEMSTALGLAQRDLTHTSLPLIEKGSISGTAFSWTGFVDDRPFITVTCRWVCDLEIPGWEVDNDWVITIEGTPSLRLNYQRGLSFDGGIRHGGSYTDPGGADFMDSHLFTSVASFVNAIGPVCVAPPGHFMAPVFGACQHRRGKEPIALRP